MKFPPILANAFGVTETPSLKTTPPPVTQKKLPELGNANGAGKNGLALKAQASDFEPLLELPRLSLQLPPPDQIPKAEGVLQGWWKMAVDVVRGSSATREVNRAKKLSSEVNALGPKYAAMSEAELKAETPRFQKEVKESTVDQQKALAAAEAKLIEATTETRPKLVEEVKTARAKLFKAEKKVLDRLLPEAFAALREASSRATGMKHYDVQVMGGVLMHHGLIAEMYTGEGKTLAATLPAYLNALAGHGFHVATVNDYLARRDAEEMSQIYGYMGMDVGVLQANNRQLVIPADGEGKGKEATRHDAYKAAITYGTASEYGFDYLRDHQARDVEDKVQRPLFGAILDEVDSLLIDEARIPLILAGKGPKPDLQTLERWDTVAKKIYDDVLDSLNGKKSQGQIFDKDDIEWDEHWVALTDKGQTKLAEAIGVPNLYDEKNLDQVSYLQDALKAHFIFQENGQYAVVEGKISTVGLGGHLGIGRRFTGGLHQALEMKHRLEVLPENLTSASITMREYLAQYQSWAGMTGTAMSARTVFSEVYGLDVARVPTRKPLVRVDYPDKHFETREAKDAQYLKDVLAAHETGRPLLLGVEFTHTAEWLGKELEARGIAVQVLGAKSDADEAKIIANAGRVGAVTVATTRGGRGVDIKLGGNAKVIAEGLVAQGMDKVEALKVAGETAAKERAQVLAMGGLAVLSYEHLDSRRRDDQLRGRAARQGEPGATLFYTSAEDRLFDDTKPKPGEKVKPYEASKAPKRTEAALDHSENKVNGALSESLPYDVTVAVYRDKLYAARDGVLESSDVRPLITQLITQALDEAFSVVGKQVKTKDEAVALYQELGKVLSLPAGDPPPSWTGRSAADIRKDIDGLVEKLVEKRDQSVGGELARVIEKAQLLATVDGIWGEFIEQSQQIREGIGWRAIAQKDPKLEYKIAIGESYGEMLAAISREISAQVLKTTPKLGAS